MSLPPRISAIIAEVAAERGVSVAEMMSRTRRAKLYAARQEAMKRVRALTLQCGQPSFPQIGRWFDRHYSSVIYACK